MPRKTDHSLTIRFTPEEYVRMQAKAGDERLSTYVRATALREAAKQRTKPLRRPRADQQLLAAILGLLSVHPLLKSFNGTQQESDLDAIDAETAAQLNASQTL